MKRRIHDVRTAVFASFGQIPKNEVLYSVIVQPSVGVGGSEGDRFVGLCIETFDGQLPVVNPMTHQRRLGLRGVKDIGLGRRAHVATDGYARAMVLRHEQIVHNGGDNAKYHYAKNSRHRIHDLVARREIYSAARTSKERSREVLLLEIGFGNHGATVAFGLPRVFDLPRGAGEFDDHAAVPDKPSIHDATSATLQIRDGIIAKDEMDHG